MLCVPLVALQLPARRLTRVAVFCFLFFFSSPPLLRFSPFIFKGVLSGSTFTSLMLNKCHFNILPSLSWLDFQELHGNVVGICGHALQVLVPAAPGTAPQRHAGRAEDVLHFSRVLLHHLHQLLNGAAETPTPHLPEEHHFRSTVCSRRSLSR